MIQSLIMEIYRILIKLLLPHLIKDYFQYLHQLALINFFRNPIFEKVNQLLTFMKRNW